MLRYTRLEEIDRQALDALVTRAASEDQYLEFVREVGEKDSEKQDFVREVAAFANASGGDIVIGIREEKGMARELLGERVENPDQRRIQLYELCTHCIEPIIMGLGIQPVKVKDDMHAFVMRIPRSFQRPHLATYKNENHLFYTRRGSAKNPLTLDELRILFSLSASLPDKIRSFHQERANLIRNAKGPIRVESSPLVFHVVPLSAFDIGQEVNLSRIANKSIRTLRGREGEVRRNLNGLLAFSDTSYVQIFRTGALEVVDGRVVNLVLESRSIGAELLESNLSQMLDRLLSIARQIEIVPPLVILLSILNVRGVIVPSPRIYEAGGRVITPTNYPIDQDDLTTPELIVEELEGVDSRIVLRRIFDAIWQAGGHAGSPSY